MPSAIVMDAPSARDLVVVGTSHRLADVDVRERLHIPLAEAAELARTLARGGGETVVLSTCNRTEIYSAQTAGLEPARRRAVAALSDVSGLPAATVEPLLYAWEGDDAATHVFRVAAGLDSLIQGESQILGQVRNAYVAAQDVGATGLILNRVFTQALRVGKRLRSELAVGDAAASVPAAAAELGQRVVGRLDGRRVLVIGAGKMGGLAAENLVNRGAGNVFVANHTPAKAEQLARRFGGEAVRFEELSEELERADLVVSSTGCPRVILTVADVERALARRNGRPIVFIDIAVPRDLDPGIGELPGCTLYDIDDLGDEAGGGLAERRAAILAAEDAVVAEVAELRRWLDSLDAVPAITALRRRAEEIRTRELERSEPRLRTLSPREREAVDVVTAQIVNKLLHAPTVRIKQAAGEPEAPVYIDALRDLFGLDERER